MKKIKDAVIRIFSCCAPLALSLAIMTSNSTCLFFSYQPDEPSIIQRYKRREKYEFDVLE